MQAIFTEVAKGDIDAVRTRLDKRPDLLAVTATGSPKKFTGKSLLMAAFAAWQFEMAEFLLERGAHPDFMETVNPYGDNRPLIHEAVKAAVFNTRWSGCTMVGVDLDEDTARRKQQQADTAWSALQALLDAGADATATSSSGISALGRAMLDAAQVLPLHDHGDPTFVPEPVRDDVVEDLDRILAALIEHGADPYALDGPRRVVLIERHRGQREGIILDGVLEASPPAAPAG